MVVVLPFVAVALHCSRRQRCSGLRRGRSDASNGEVGGGAQAVPIKDETTVQKIHLNFRLTYLKDVRTSAVRDTHTGLRLRGVGY
eukprot:3211349-Rhodomonas_salina.1